MSHMFSIQDLFYYPEIKIVQNRTIYHFEITILNIYVLHILKSIY